MSCWNAEIQLRSNIEAVAKMRRDLPLGGELAEDYVFEEAGGGSARKVRFSELFAEGKDTLIIYSYMYGPQMAQSCVSCTSILDALDGEAPHVMQRTNLAVIAKSPIARIMELTNGRGGGTCDCSRLRTIPTITTTTQSRPRAISCRR